MPPTLEQLLDDASRARRERRLDDARRDVTAAVALCRGTGTRRDLARALMASGQIERDLGRGAAAWPFYEEAVALSREDGEPLALAHSARHLGDLHREAGRLDQAGTCYDEALRLYRAQEETDRLDLANAIRPLAILREATGDAAAARGLWAEARDLYAAAGIAAGVTECTARLARLDA